jgi:protein-S-isoprenylcysteine O-methyltransferase Ste14
MGCRMRKPAAILGSALFFVVVPFMIAGPLPWWITHWHFRPALLGSELTRFAGVALIVAGLPGLLDSFRRFAVEGLGTPAPVAPPEQLVVSGLYRHVRNPMYVAVLALLAGQALLFGSPALLAVSALFWLVTHLFVIAYEEPTLESAFGAKYLNYRANVPRWIPRLSAWRG